MTTNRDKFENRAASEEWGISQEWTVGVPKDGFADPTGEYPKRDYFFSNSIGYAARGAKINRLWTSGSYFNVNYELFPPKSSIFPFSQTNETPSGHSVEIDDTPGAERILLKHRTGSGVELRPDGSVVLSSRQQRVEMIGGSHKMIVSGSGDVVYEGDLTLTVTGDYRVKVGGDYTVDVGSDVFEKFDGSHRTEVAKTRSEIVRGSKDTRVQGDTVALTLSDRKTITKGEYEVLTEGEYHLYNGGNVQVTTPDFSVSASDINLTAGTMRLAASGGFVGGSSVIHYGKTYTGPNNGTDDVKGGGVTYYGSLVGRAFEAWTSKYSIYADEAHSAHISNYATVAEWADLSGLAETAGEAPARAGTADNASATAVTPQEKWPVTIPGADVKDGSKILNQEPAFNYGVGVVGGGDDTGIIWNVNDIDIQETMPGNAGSENTQDILLSETSSNIKNVYIDAPSLSQKIAKTQYYGFFDHEPTVSEVRALIRTWDPAQQSQDQNRCLFELVRRGIISTVYNVSTPISTTGVVVGQTPIKKYGKRVLGNPPENKSKSFLTSIGRFFNITQLTFVPDPLYSPTMVWDDKDFAGEANMELAKGVPISKFFGAPGSRTAISQVPVGETLAQNSDYRIFERKELAQQYYLHAQLLHYINNHDDYSNHRLVVSEGWFNPLPAAREVAKSKWFSLFAAGTAVSYKLLNSAGSIDFEKTFELAVHLKDFLDYDRITLDYDTLNPSGSLSAQIIVTMPPFLDTRWQPGRLDYKLETYFNRNLYAATELVKIIPENLIL